jgi:hypothetical protein
MREVEHTRESVRCQRLHTAAFVKSLSAESDTYGMKEHASKIIAVLGLAVVVAVALFAQSASRAASLEARITTLETERAGLQAKLSTAEKQTAAVRARLRPFETKQAASTRINEELLLEAGTIQTYRFSPTVVPGTLTGSWRSSGRGAGGADDTINQFRLTDPKDAILETSERQSSSGRFFVKISERGTYTFFFDNKGVLRSTARRVFLEGEFRPE